MCVFYRSGAIGAIGFIFCLRGECHRRIESKFTHHFILSSAFVLSYRQIRQPSNQESVNQVIKKLWPHIVIEPPPPLPVAMAHIFYSSDTDRCMSGVTSQECAIRIDVWKWQHPGAACFLSLTRVIQNNGFPLVHVHHLITWPTHGSIDCL